MNVRATWSGIKKKELVCNPEEWATIDSSDF